MTVWCMNLKDNRNESNRNIELKFALCQEKNMLAIGWGVSSEVKSFQEYLEVGAQKYSGDRGFTVATNNLQRLKRGDLVWVKNPKDGTRFLVEIEDDEPGICDNLMEFDNCAYRKGQYYAVDDGYLMGAFTPKNLCARHTLERMHTDTRGEVVAATKELFAKLK